MVKTLNSDGFCNCPNPTIDKDNNGVRYCKRCSKDTRENMSDGIYAFGDHIEDLVKKDNLAAIQDATQDNLERTATPSDMAPDADCPFCYGKTGWSYSTGDAGDEEDEAYCGDCDIVYKIKTGEYVSGSGDPKTIKAKHNKPAKGAEDKSVKIIKNKGTDDKKDDIFEKHYCVADKSSTEGFTIKCEYCPAKFQNWPEAMKHETVDSNGNKRGTSYSGGDYSGGYANCSHDPGHVINGGEEGWNVFVGSKWGCSGKLKDFDLVINLTGDSVFRTGHIIPVSSLSKFAGKESKNLKPVEIVLDWPDMGILDLGRNWWDALAAHIRKSKSKVVMFCMGGHGRTGTALATLLVVMLDWDAKDAIDWVRKNHCKKAIETVAQMRYIYAMAGENPPDDLTARKGEGPGVKFTKITTVGGSDHKGGYQQSLETGTTVLL